jgi:glycosyltransferase involved in cell wall biosynthesis
MRVLFVDQFGELGGAQRCLLDLIPALPPLGWSACAAIPETGGLRERLEQSGVTVHAIEQIGLEPLRYPAQVLRTRNRIREIVTRERIDLIYANGPRVLPAACFLAVPVLLHAHNYPKPAAARALVRTMLRLQPSTRVIAVSRFAASYLSSNVTIIRNGVASAAAVAPRSKTDGQFRIGLIGRIAPEKGHLDFLEAIRHLKSGNLRFFIYGKAMLASHAYELEVRRQAQGLPVEFVGWCEDIAEVLANLDLVVVPSAPVEAQPRVILEAFSAGVPVLAYPGGGISEIIEDGRTGFLTRGLGPAALADKIRELVHTDPKILRETVQRAREVWQSRHTLERYRSEVTRVMAQAANKTRIPAADHTGE